MFKNIKYCQLKKAGYNRGINRTHVNRIKRDFHEDMVQPAIVSFRDGNYYIIDHQHQTQAIYEMNGNDPNTLIYCDVRTGLTYEQEADLYYRLNTGSKTLTFADKLKGLIESKDTTALQFRDTVEACGYSILDRTNASLRALSTAWNIFKKKDGKSELEQILNLTFACWPNDNNGAHTHIIQGVQLFLKIHGDEFDRDRFIKKLSALDPRDLVKKADSYYKQMDSRAFTKPYCMYTLLITNYNTGLKYKLTPSSPQA